MPRELPPHGTRSRYRIEIKTDAQGARGEPCDACRAANTAASRNQRANARATVARAGFSIVEDQPQAEVDASADASTSAHRRTAKDRRVGTMEAAVQKDIDEIDPTLHVPFHRTLSALAIELAEEIDEPATAAAARRDARKQLFEVLRSLRTQKEGDDGSALNVLLEQAGFGVPLVSGGAT